ncbi:hypothetical protein [Caballeronia sp. LZ043]|uniref:hypothetical protein n=1 Tax=Caballeronia sp. LZ043 TaxID=3038569 RepID=UPI0028601773|nr:hypothetical protein [Caballeronia sp. LZ043]MDR5824727.1 hypothetical protein [Caballeronia sp. LZ043]
MAINHDLVPEYVVLVNENERYKLNSKRQNLGQPSDDLLAYAQQKGTFISVDASAWDDFARDFGLSRIDRERRCCYIVLKYNETEEQLQTLIDM